MYRHDTALVLYERWKDCRRTAGVCHRAAGENGYHGMIMGSDIRIDPNVT